MSFDSIQIFLEIASLSFQVSCPHQFLTDLKKKWILFFFRYVFQFLG